MATATLNAFTLPAPAKLNLFLHITGRRADGYHLLQTLFALLDYGDEIQFRAADALTLNVAGGVPAGDDNLVMRAARALRDATGCRRGADMMLTKRLPVGGGVGGGSSDAATALLGLNALWRLGLDEDELAAIGVSLGADVPVFVRGHSAWAEGVGEQLQPVDLPRQDYLVIYPDVAVSTAGIFGDPQLTRDNPKSTLAAFFEPGTDKSFSNVCQPVARRLFPAIGEALDWLESKAGNSRMTGTGSCVFARIADRQQGETLLDQLPPRWTGFVACSLSTSPALEALDRLRQTKSTARQ